MPIIGFALVALCSVLQPCNFPRVNFPYLLHFAEIGPKYITTDIQFDDLYAPVYAPLDGTSGLYYYPLIFTNSNNSTEAWVARFDTQDWFNTFNIGTGLLEPPALTYVTNVVTGTIAELMPEPFFCRSEACLYVLLDANSRQHITYFYNRDDFTEPAFQDNPRAFYNFKHFVVNPNRNSDQQTAEEDQCQT